MSDTIAFGIGQSVTVADSPEPALAALGFASGDDLVVWASTATPEQLNNTGLAMSVLLATGGDQ